MKKRDSFCMLYSLYLLLANCQQEAPVEILTPDWERKHEGLFVMPLYEEVSSLKQLLESKSILEHNDTCLTNVFRPGDSDNKAISNVEKLPSIIGTTYWLNDWLHVGHVHYDIVLLQALQTVKIERIVLQRPNCHKANAVSLCKGKGSFLGWYAGYFTAILEAANATNVPIYMRRWKGEDWKPVYFSSRAAPTFVLSNSSYPSSFPNSSLDIRELTCFERILRRNVYLPGKIKFGAVPSVGAQAVKRFKKAAFKPFNIKFGFTDTEGPLTILFSYRTSPALRVIENQHEIVAALKLNFPSPVYRLTTLNNSNPDLGYEAQLRDVSSAHVVITTHGAFQANMLFMQNRALLVELFGNIHHLPTHVFHRLALSFQLFYGRVHASSFKSMYQPSFNMSTGEIQSVVSMVRQYFDGGHWKSLKK
jgi:hypothetical protein